MKNLKLIILFCLMAGLAKSQPYGELTYPHTGGSTISSGTITNLNAIAGFLMAGYRPSSIASTPDFFIDQVDKNGVFTGPGSFSNSYKIKTAGTSANCAGVKMPVNTCNGVTVIESPVSGSPNGECYAIAGTYSNTLFFSCLKSDGSPISPGFYTFTNTPTATSMSKPLLALAPNIGGGAFMYYYICGSYVASATGIQYMYVLVVDENGTVFAQSEFHFPTGNGVGILEPKGIVEDVLFSGDLIIVGRAYDPSSNFGMLGTRGFYMQLTVGASTPNIFNLCGQAPSVNAPEAFTAITPEANGSSYIVGGTSNFVAGATDWFVKIPSSGSPFSFSNIITTSNGDNIGGPTGVLSTQITSTANVTNVFNYGISQSPTRGIVTMKLDNVGNAWTSGFALINFNTFFYNISGQISRPLSITGKINGPVDEGIHVFGEDISTTAGTHYLTLAYFNGQESCVPSRSASATTSPGPTVIVTNTNVVGTPTPGYLYCTNLDLGKTSLTPNVNTICTPANPVSGGSNNKLNTATGITEATQGSYNLNLAPNPTTGKITLNYNTQGNGKVQFTLYNGLGQLVKQVYTGQDTGGDHSLDLDFNSMGLEAGIYFLNAELDGTHTTQKIIYTKN